MYTNNVKFNTHSSVSLNSLMCRPYYCRESDMLRELQECIKSDPSFTKKRKCTSSEEFEALLNSKKSAETLNFNKLWMQYVLLNQLFSYNVQKPFGRNKACMCKPLIKKPNVSDLDKGSHDNLLVLDRISFSSSSIEMSALLEEKLNKIDGVKRPKSSKRDYKKILPIPTRKNNKTTNPNTKLFTIESNESLTELVRGLSVLDFHKDEEANNNGNKFHKAKLKDNENSQKRKVNVVLKNNSDQKIHNKKLKSQDAPNKKTGKNKPITINNDTRKIELHLPFSFDHLCQKSIGDEIKLLLCKRNRNECRCSNCITGLKISASQLIPCEQILVHNKHDLIAPVDLDETKQPTKIKAPEDKIKDKQKKLRNVPDYLDDTEQLSELKEDKASEGKIKDKQKKKLSNVPADLDEPEKLSAIKQDKVPDDKTKDKQKKKKALSCLNKKKPPNQDKKQSPVIDDEVIDFLKDQISKVNTEEPPNRELINALKTIAKMSDKQKKQQLDKLKKKNNISDKTSSANKSSQITSNEENLLQNHLDEFLSNISIDTLNKLIEMKDGKPKKLDKLKTAVDKFQITDNNKPTIEELLRKHFELCDKCGKINIDEPLKDDSVNALKKLLKMETKKTNKHINNLINEINDQKREVTLLKSLCQKLNEDITTSLAHREGDSDLNEAVKYLYRIYEDLSQKVHDNEKEKFHREYQLIPEKEKKSENWERIKSNGDGRVKHGRKKNIDIAKFERDKVEHLQTDTEPTNEISAEADIESSSSNNDLNRVYRDLLLNKETSTLGTSTEPSTNLDKLFFGKATCPCEINFELYHGGDGMQVGDKVSDLQTCKKKLQSIFNKLSKKHHHENHHVTFDKANDSRDQSKLSTTESDSINTIDEIKSKEEKKIKYKKDQDKVKSKYTFSSDSENQTDINKISKTKGVSVNTTDEKNKEGKKANRKNEEQEKVRSKNNISSDKFSDVSVLQLYHKDFIVYSVSDKLHEIPEKDTATSEKDTGSSEQVTASSEKVTDTSEKDEKSEDSTEEDTKLLVNNNSKSVTSSFMLWLKKSSRHVKKTEKNECKSSKNSTAKKMLGFVKRSKYTI